MEPGDVVLIKAFDDVPEHWFRVEEVYEDCITGQALNMVTKRFSVLREQAGIYRKGVAHPALRRG